MLTWKDIDVRVINISGDLVALYPIPKSKSGCSISLIIENFSELNQALDEGLARQIEDPYVYLRATTPTGASKKKAEERYEKIKPFLSDNDIIFDEKKRSDTLNKLCSGNQSMRMSLQRILSTWWKKGQSIGALIPEYGKNVGVKHNCKIKAGRSSQSTKDVVPLNDEIRNIFDEVCRKYLLVGNKRVSLSDAHKHAMNIFLEHHPEKTISQAPTFYQFKHYYYSHFNQLERTKGRNSKIHYEKDIRGLHGSVYDIARGPGHIVEIDSTPLDIFIVRESDRSKVISTRPTMYVVTDVYSGMILGVSASLEPAQYSSAADALYISMTDKRELCAKYGIELKTGEWPCKGIPEIVIADNAELASEQIERFTSIYGVSISNSVSYRADQKSMVERSHSLIMDKIKEFITAYPTGMTLRKEGCIDNRDKAELTLTECNRMIILSALCANQRIKEKLPEDYPAEKDPVPLELWNFGISHGKSHLRIENNYEHLQLSLLKRLKVIFTKESIKAEGIHWICNEILYKGLLERNQKNKKPKDMELAVDFADVSIAYLFPDPVKSPFTYWKCSLAPVSSRLKGMSLYEAKRFMAIANETRAIAKRKLSLIHI